MTVKRDCTFCHREIEIPPGVRTIICPHCSTIQKVEISRPPDRKQTFPHRHLPEGYFE